MKNFKMRELNFLSDLTLLKLSAKNKFLLCQFLNGYSEMGLKTFFIEEIKSCTRKKDINKAIFEKLQELNTEEFNQVAFSQISTIPIGWKVETEDLFKLIDTFGYQHAVYSDEILKYLYDENYTKRLLECSTADDSIMVVTGYLNPLHYSFKHNEIDFSLNGLNNFRELNKKYGLADFNSTIFEFYENKQEVSYSVQNAFNYIVKNI